MVEQLKQRRSKMAALHTPDCNFGTPAIDYELMDCDGRVWTLEQCKGEKGLLIMFICNHCPYVKTIIADLVKTTNILNEHGIRTVAIMPNDWDTYPEDAPSVMREFQETYNFKFPYLIDATQQVAKQYGAVCTPDFFGYNHDLKLQYRGRFNSRGRSTEVVPSDNELERAMLMIAETGMGPTHQHASIGCSIKWRDE
jgi:peroxiredoxin